MNYKAEQDQKKVISWVIVMGVLGIILFLFGLQSNFYYLIGLLLFVGSIWIFMNRKKPFFEINDTMIKVNKLHAPRTSIIEVDFFSSGEGGSFNTVVLKLNLTLESLMNRRLNIWERYSNKSFALGPQQISIDMGSSRELKKHLPKIQEWLPGKVKPLN